MRYVMVVGMVLALGVGRSTAAQDFGYFGELGPVFWGAIDPLWGTCSAGASQSPVEFSSVVPAPPRLRGPALSYGESRGYIFNNGHTIEVETEGENALELNGTRFDLVQFHFHTPSEHRVGRRGYDMELHLVHRSPAGALAVIGVLLTRGATSGALGPVFDAVPSDIGIRHALETPFNPARFLPNLRAHYRYAGSLTTPPCSEGVAWFVFAQPVTISDEHMARFAQRVPFNARPVLRRLP